MFEEGSHVCLPGHDGYVTVSTAIQTASGWRLYTAAIRQMRRQT